ncbi:response regulator [Massilia oculi]|uniref:response regulator n=1 Tax=Massilia oculi TaxID=945844 RepID=UPI001AAECC02|nr:response regulator [Massilia oculi]
MQDNGTSEPLRVLLVERDEDVREIFVALFTILGHSATAVQSPAEALDLVEGLRPNIVYTSLVFQDMHGFELATRLRQMPELEHTLMIAVSGLHYSGIENMAKAAGFDGYLLKPVSMEALTESIALYYGERPKQFKTLWN